MKKLDRIPFSPLLLCIEKKKKKKKKKKLDRYPNQHQSIPLISHMESWEME
jgi:hypothetical protein